MKKQILNLLLAALCLAPIHLYGMDLIAAAQAGNLDQVQALLQPDDDDETVDTTVDVNAVDTDGRTALWHACAGGYNEVANYLAFDYTFQCLIFKKPPTDINKMSSDGLTPLAKAIQQRYRYSDDDDKVEQYNDIIGTLLSTDGIDINAGSTYDTTPAYFALKSKDPHTLERLTEENGLKITPKLAQFACLPDSGISKETFDELTGYIPLYRALKKTLPGQAETVCAHALARNIKYVTFMQDKFRRVVSYSAKTDQPDQYAWRDNPGKQYDLAQERIPLLRDVDATNINDLIRGMKQAAEQAFAEGIDQQYQDAKEMWNNMGIDPSQHMSKQEFKKLAQEKMDARFQGIPDTHEPEEDSEAQDSDAESEDNKNSCEIQ